MGERISSMNDRERFLNTMRCQPVDRPPLHLVGPWPDTLARWRREGLPGEVEDVHEYLGAKRLRALNVTGVAGIYPPFEERIISEKDGILISIDAYGRTTRTFKDHTSMPEWIDFPVNNPDDLRRAMDEHFDVENLDARFTPEWEEKVRTAPADAVIVLDGGGYYWTLRSLAGVETTSYLLYDAPELVDELFERYFTVVMEGFRRVAPRIKVDVIGFGEDIAYKNGPLVSPAMFRDMILPRYRKAMDVAREKGIDLTWYDSDGDLRLLIPDCLSVGINGLAPCEVAAGMDPVALRKQYGKELRMIGGFDKRVVAEGKASIDAEIERLKPVIEEGGFLPAIDHSVSADISFDNYRYYLDAIQETLGIRT